MENAKSIIDIEVNDDQFKRFHEMFNSYREQLGSAPNAWKESEQAADGMNAAVRDLISAQMAQTKLLDEERKKREAMRAEAEAMANMEQAAQQERAAAAKTAHDEEKKHQGQILKSSQKELDNYQAKVKAARKLGDALTGIVGTTASIGFNIAKWGIGGAIGLLGGSAFGLERLGANATQERTQSRILGVSPGQLRAWHTDFGSYGNPDNLLSSASNAPTDAGMRALYMRAGVSASTIREGNTSDIAQQALRGLSEFFNRNKGPNAQAVWQGHGFDQIMSYNDMRGFAGASPAEQAQVLRNIRRDTSGMNTNDSTMKAWQDFYTQLQRVGGELKTTFLDGLVGITKPLSDLAASIKSLVRDIMGSDGFKDIIEAISQGLRSLDDAITDGSLQKGIQNFVDAVGQFANSDELKQDLTALREAIHLAATAVEFITKSPLFGGSGWGGEKAVGEKDGQIQWQDDPNVKRYGPKEVWDMIKSPFSSVSSSSSAGGKKTYQDALRQSQQSMSMINQSSLIDNTGMPHDQASAYLRAIAMAESGGDPTLTSNAGAQGMFQLMPAVQEHYGVKNAFDPNQSLMGASKFVHDLMRRFGGDMTKVTAAYNAGPERVAKTVAQYGGSWMSHMPRETQNYVDKVGRDFNTNSGRLSVNITNATGGSAVVTARQSMGL